MTEALAVCLVGFILSAQLVAALLFCQSAGLRLALDRSISMLENFEHLLAQALKLEIFKTGSLSALLICSLSKLVSLTECLSACEFELAGV